VDERETIAIFIHLPLEMTMMHTLTRSPLLLLTLALVLVSCQANDAPRDAPSQKPPVASSSKPNILFILADDLGKEWISCYGAEDIKTPHIDALAADGMLFHNAYSMPQCTPSRATLLTGTYPWRNGFVNHWDVPRWGVGYFDWKQKENTTFARLLKDLGYKTAISGKWQINDFRIEPEALKKHGFDDWAMWTGFETGNPPSRERYSDPYVHTSEGSKTYPGKFGPDIYTDFLIGFMKKHKDQPLCLYYAMCLPHTPYVATPDEPNAETKMEKQKAMVGYLDKCVGRLVSALDELGLRDNTIVIFTTDNGSTGSATGTRNGIRVSGAKAKKIEAGVNAPFIVNGPGLVPAGVETDALTDFSDLLPTFVELAGGTVPEDLTIDGISIAPVLLGKAQESGREWIMALGHGHAALDEHGVRGVRDFAGRVIRDHQFKVWVNEERQIDRLHDLKADPLEKNNLVESADPAHQAAIQKFQKVVDSLPKKDGRPLYEPRAPNPWDRKKK
jgi:arylsulfatase A-like enzyme